MEAGYFVDAEISAIRSIGLVVTIANSLFLIKHFTQENHFFILRLSLIAIERLSVSDVVNLYNIIVRLGLSI